MVLRQMESIQKLLSLMALLMIFINLNCLMGNLQINIIMAT